MEENITITDAYSQRKRIIAYMEQHGGITSFEATHYLNIMSPRKRLSEINRITPLTKKVEYSIRMVNGRKKTTRYIKYSIAGQYGV